MDEGDESKGDGFGYQRQRHGEAAEHAHFTRDVE
jgi:hypothetical protein